MVMVPPVPGTDAGAVYMACCVAPDVVEGVMVPTVLLPPAIPFTVQFTPTPLAPLVIVAMKFTMPPVPRGIGWGWLCGLVICTEAVVPDPTFAFTVEVLSATSVVSPTSETVAVLAILPDAAPLMPTVRVIFPAAEPFATDAWFVHVTTCRTAAHVQFVPVPLTNVNAALSVSVTVIVPAVAAVPMLLTAIWNMPFDPATKAPEVVLVIERSGAAAVTVTVAVDELFAALLSSVVCTVAVLLMLPVAAAFTATVSTMFAAEALPAIGPEFVQVTSCATAEQAQPVPVPETNVKLAFSVSVTVMPPTVGPVLTLFTAMEYVAFDPATKLLDAVFTIARSGAAAMATVFVDVLFAALLSPVVATTAVSDRFPAGAAALTRTVSVILAAEAPFAIGPAFVQVTSWATFTQPHPVP